MLIKAEKFNGRQAWRLSNGQVDLVTLAGGGHIAGVFLRGGPKVNPYWQPKWRTIEPWQYRAAMADKYGAKLLACISGHNVCLGVFGGPSPDEARAGGPGCHGEAPIVRWRVLGRQCSARRLTFTYGCELPVARMALRRTLTMLAGSCVVGVREVVENLAPCDVPFTMCQHVSFSAPFVEPGATVFDLAGSRAHTFPGIFGKSQRLRPDTAFTWPDGPGARGKVDLRTMGRGRNSDFYTILMHARPAQTWFSAMHPGQGMLVAYAWRPADYPWTGVWEENRARTAPPWNGREVTRGMEFANAPFPMSLREAVTMGRFQGQPAYRWLPARGSATFEYAIIVRRVEPGARGVADVRTDGAAAEVSLI